MRKIEFRAWDLLNKRMLNWGEIFDLPAWEIFPGTPEQRAFNVMQYTGLNDKNGKEIYEGDILQGGHYPISKDDGYVLVVEYDHDRFWAVRTMKSTTDVRGISHGIADGLYEFEDSDLEVIGNIYENPELLEGEYDE